MRKIKNWFKNLERINGMTVICNKFIPFPGYKAINLFGVLFVRGNARIDDITLNHENIHTQQGKELFWIGFYILYIGEWLVNFIRFKNFKEAYLNISFEKEAYANEKNTEYLKTRRLFTFLNYLK